MSFRFVVVGLLLVLLASASLLPTTALDTHPTSYQDKHIKPVARFSVSDDYTPHAPIEISSDEDFATQGWPGQGTPSNPYVIAGLSIAGSPALNISGTTVHFRVDSCEIIGDPEAWHEAAIVTSASDAVVRQCTFRDSASWALGIYQSSADIEACVFLEVGEAVHCQNGQSLGVRGCRFQSIRYMGVSVYSMQEVNIENNTFQFVSDAAVSVSYCSSANIRLNRINSCGESYYYARVVELSRNTLTVFEQNEVTQCPAGVSVYLCPDAVVRDNRILCDGLDLSLSASPRTVLENNTMNRGLYMDAYPRTGLEITVSGNTVGGRPLVVHRGASNLSLSGVTFGQLFLIECENITVADCEIVDTAQGISAAYCSAIRMDSIGFSGCRMCINIHESSGILMGNLNAKDCSRFSYIRKSSGVTITGNDITTSSEEYYASALAFESCYSLRILGCSFTTDSTVILSANDCVDTDIYNSTFRGSASYGSGNLISIGSSQDTTIANNTLQSGTYALLGVYYAASLRVEDNTMLYGYYGCSLTEAHGGLIRGNTIFASDQIGLLVSDTWNLRIERNEILECGEGIRLERAHLCSIDANRICRNYEAGLVLDSVSTLNRIYGNEIGYNGLFQNNNAVDDGFRNEWHLNGVGNCWSDWGEDGPYYIPGNGQGADEFPLLLEDDYDHPPLVMTLESITYRIGSENQLLNWWAFDSNPHRYSVAVDGLVVRTAQWHGYNVTYSLLGLGPGRHSVSLTVEDLTGYSATTTVWVEVMQSSGPNEWLASVPISVIAIIGQVALVVVFGYLVRKKAKEKEVAIGMPTDSGLSDDHLKRLLLDDESD